ncbi:MAG: 16S rRNA (uracil(1498)-N(3))-methyltransferase [Phycisphaerales bacterium]|nr:16S rRNA (uracil(1498)-N(3))-methyltransferase [Phycisphaerales bacterium]
MPSHRVWLDQFPDPPGSRVIVGGEEAHHAVRVKRLVAGDPVELLDGRGRLAKAVVAHTRKLPKHGGWEIELAIQSSQLVPRTIPEIQVWSAAPKRDRLDSMIDGLAQAGIASWSPLLTQRSVVEPRDGKLSRLARISAEACKQSGRAWVMEIGDGGTIADGLMPSASLVLADASGSMYCPAKAQAIRLLIGPEGGWTPDEIAAARHAGAQIACFGPHTMRIETAAVVAAGIVVNAAAAQA